MKETKFTEGNWSIATIPPNGCIPIGTNGLMVCMTTHSIIEPDQVDEAMANAHLIKTAPKLYSALELVLKAVEKLSEDALGEVKDTPDKQGWFIRDELLYNISNLLAEARGEQ